MSRHAACDRCAEIDSVRKGGKLVKEILRGGKPVRVIGEKLAPEYGECGVGGLEWGRKTGMD